MKTKLDFSRVNSVAVAAFIVFFAAGFAVEALIKHPWPRVVGFLIGFYLLFAIKVVQQWEKVALLRLGRYVGLRGPGWFHVIPVFETISHYIDQRVRVHSVT